MKQPQTLIELAELAVTKRQASGRRLAELAQNEGFALASTTFNHIRAGRYKSTPTDETIRAIGWLAGVSDEVAFAAAGQKAPGLPLADELPPGADNLSAKARKTIIDLTRVLIEYEAGSNEQDHQPNKSIEQLRAVAPTGDPSSRQKIDALTPEEIKIVAMRENRRRRREHGDFMHGISEHPEMSTSMIKQGKSQKEVRDALIEAGKSAREEIRELGVAGRAIQKEHAASATPGSIAKKGTRYEVINPKGSVSGHSGPGSITELHGAEAAKYPAPPVEQLAAHPKVKTRREQLDEHSDTAENPTNFED